MTKNALLSKNSHPGFEPIHTARIGPEDFLTHGLHWENRLACGRIASGRLFTAKDPILFNGLDTNLYGYVQNDPVNLVDPNGLNPTVGGAVIGGAIGGPPGAAVGAVVGTIAGATIGQWIWDNWMSMGDRPPGFWPGDKGAEEWGRRNGVGKREGRGRFHGIKQGCPGSRATDDYSVNPDTGDVIDPEGENVGNLEDVKPK